MDKKTFIIGVLSLSAVVLFAANLLQPRTANAGLVVKDNDYTAVTARTTPSSSTARGRPCSSASTRIRDGDARGRSR